MSKRKPDKKEDKPDKEKDKDKNLKEGQAKDRPVEKASSKKPDKTSGKEKDKHKDEKEPSRKDKTIRQEKKVDDKDAEKNSKKKSRDKKTSKKTKKLKNSDIADSSSGKRVKLPKGFVLFTLETALHDSKATVDLPAVSSYYVCENSIILLNPKGLIRSYIQNKFQIEYFLTNWMELNQTVWDKLPSEIIKIRVQSKRSTPELIGLPSYARELNQYIGINLKSAKDLGSSLLRDCNPYVVVFAVGKKHLRFKSQTKNSTTDPFWGEHFVIPIPIEMIKNGKIADTLVLHIYNEQKGGQHPLIGKTKFPLSVLERGHARPQGVIAKLDHGGQVDLELRWFQDKKSWASPKDGRGFRTSIASGSVFFNLPPTKTKQGHKKDRKTELEWFQLLSPILPQDLQAGDILIQKSYEETEPDPNYDTVVEGQRKYTAPCATMRSCHSLLVVKDGGETVGIHFPEGIHHQSAVQPHCNYIVYRCINSSWGAEAATWALSTLTSHPGIKYNSGPSLGEMMPPPKDVEKKGPIVFDGKDLPSEMMCAEFITIAFQQNKDAPGINLTPSSTTPMKLENYINQHLSQFSFAGVIQASCAAPVSPRSKSKKSRKQNKQNTRMQETSPSPVAREEGKGEPTPSEPEEPPGPHPGPVFGVKIEDLHTNGSVPYFWTCLFSFLSNPMYINTEGILRVPGSVEEANYYRNLFDLGRDVTFKCSCHDAVGLLKMYLRELPEPVIPQIFDQQIPLIFSSYEAESDELAQEIKFVISSLPEPNKIFFTMLMSLLHKIAISETNKMTVENVIRCIVPTLKCGPQIVLYGLNEYSKIFDEEEDGGGLDEYEKQLAALQKEEKSVILGNSVEQKEKEKERDQTTANRRNPPAWAVRDKDKKPVDGTKSSETPLTPSNSTKEPIGRTTTANAREARRQERTTAREASGLGRGASNDGKAPSPKPLGSSAELAPPNHPLPPPPGQLPETPPTESVPGSARGTYKKKKPRNRDTLVFYDAQKVHQGIAEVAETIAAAEKAAQFAQDGSQDSSYQTASTTTSEESSEYSESSSGE